eukprot:254771_1
MATPFKRIDGALAQHYANCNRNDYLDENGIGKFMRFVKKHEFDEDAIDLELGDDVTDPNDCLFTEMDPAFPLPISNTQNEVPIDEVRNNQILKILKHCYRHGVAPNQSPIHAMNQPLPKSTEAPPLNPIHRLLDLSEGDEFVLTWQHIANALQHELYDKIASSFMVIVNGNKRFEDVNELLEEIKNKKHIHHNELNYIRELMERASQFDRNNASYAMRYHTDHTPHIQDAHAANNVHETSEADDKRFRIDMADILSTFDAIDDKRLTHGVLSFLNDEQYDTESFIYDFNKNDRKMPQFAECITWEKVKQMKDISVIKIEDVLKFIRNKQYKESDLDGKEVYLVYYQQDTNKPIVYETGYEDRQTRRTNGRALIAFLDSRHSKECKENPQKYGIYDLDGLFGDCNSQTMRERCCDEWRTKTKNIIKDFWESQWTSIPSHFESSSNLLRIKLIYSNRDIDDAHHGLSFHLLYDIYNVHKCFLFANYHSIHYDTVQFVNDIQNCKHFDSSIKRCIRNIGFEDTIIANTIDLYPSYIIDDDMYAICKYFFCASRVVNKERETNNNDFAFTMCIIPKRIVCIYDNDVTIPFGIADIESYLEAKQMNVVKITVAHSNDIMDITALLEDQINTIKTSNVLCVVDKRDCDCDVLYIIRTNSDSAYALPELYQNSCIALEFNVSSTVRCYMRYGNGRMRFYPEYLTTIIPRFFKRNAQLSYARNMDNLYTDWHKHGFAIDLDDKLFNKYYKMITKYEHISVNYNRSLIEPKKNPRKCVLNAILDTEQCPFIDYIIYCLNLFKDMKANAIAFD